MAFTSDLTAFGDPSKSQNVYDDSNLHKLLDGHVSADGTKCGFGLTPRDYSKQPFGSLAFAKPFPKEWYVPRSKWPELIAKMEAAKSRVSDVLRRNKVPSLNQQSTSSCWGQAVTTALQYQIVAAGFPYLHLSATSVTARLTNGRDQGGWCSQAAEGIADFGINTWDEWPDNSLNLRKYDTAENQEKAKRRLLIEWYELPAGDFDAMMGCFFRGLSVPKGHGWWRHAVNGCDAVALGRNRYGSRDRNSWGDDYEDEGFFILEESKAAPDDAIVPVLSLIEDTVT